MPIPKHGIWPVAVAKGSLGVGSTSGAGDAAAAAAVNAGADAGNSGGQTYLIVVAGGGIKTGFSASRSVEVLAVTPPATTTTTSTSTSSSTSTTSTSTTTAAPIAMQHLLQTQNNVVSMQNPYLFNGEAYDAARPIGMSIGAYTFTGITTAHPFGILAGL